MRVAKLLPVSLICLIAAASMTMARAGDGRPPQLTVNVVRPPNPMTAYGKAYLVYELILTNYDSSAVELHGLSVADPDKSASFDFSGERLNAMLAPAGKPASEGSLGTIASGESRIVFMWLEFADPSRVPRRLAHLIRYRVKRGEENVDDELALAPVAIDDAPPLTIGPPLKGGDWLTGGGPGNDSYHRRAHMIIDGVIHFAQRFAIDYVLVGADGKTFSGDAKKNQSYHCYGADVIAVADGVVAAARDGIPENVPDPTARAVKMTLDTAGGNYVALSIGYGRYALYGHLVPGSLKVRKGDVVKRGQVLARLGNSGNSTEPHLHFQIADAPSFLNADGLPYLYDRVEVKPSRIAEPSTDIPVVQATGPAQEHLATMLLENQVVLFGK
jgi:hypothetical protein